MERIKKAIAEMENRGFTEISIEFLKLLIADLEEFPELSEAEIISEFYDGIDKLTD